MTEITIDELRLCTCKKHYEERCKILYKEGRLICWSVDNSFQEPPRCIVCMEEENEKLREANLRINEKRILLIHGLDAAWTHIDKPSDETLKEYKTRRKAIEHG